MVALHGFEVHGDQLDSLAERIAAHLARGEPASAEALAAQWSEQAQARWPNSPYELGLMHLEQGNLLLSRQCLEDAIAKRHTDGEAAIGLGWVCLMLRDLGGARHAFSQVEAPSLRRAARAGMAELAAAEVLGHRPLGEIWNAWTPRLTATLKEAELVIPWPLLLAADGPVSVAR